MVSLGNLCDFHLSSIRLLHCLSWHDLTHPCEQARLADTEREKAVLREELDTFRDNFQAQQTSWLDEKEKVIRYEWMDGKRRGDGRTDGQADGDGDGRTDGLMDRWLDPQRTSTLPQCLSPWDPPPPLPQASVPPYPRGCKRGGDTHSPACEGGGRVEKKLSTLSTL